MDRWQRSCLDSIGIHGLLFLGLTLLMMYWPRSIEPTNYVEIQITSGGDLGGSGGGMPNVGGITVPIKSTQTEALVQEAMNEVEAALATGQVVTSDNVLALTDTINKQTTLNSTNHHTGLDSRNTLIQGGSVNKEFGNSEGQGAWGNGTGTGIGSGNGAGDASGDGRGTGEGSGDGLGAGFARGSDGVYTANDGTGIDYTIIYDAQGQWPDEARTIGYNKVVRVNVQILVDTDGSISSVEVLNEVPNLGFKEEAVRAAYRMRFEPIYYKGHNIRMYMIKPIEFYPQ